MMEEPIVNRVSQSSLKVFDLEDLYVPGLRTSIDLSQWLYEGLILREKEFRAALKEVDWSLYKDHHIALSCSSECILPQWAFALVATHLSTEARTVAVGSLEHLETVLYERQLSQVDFREYVGVPVILKGCSNKPVPQQAYLTAAVQLKKTAKKLMYGEACSAVPL
jgi:hypothetical protein